MMNKTGLYYSFFRKLMLSLSLVGLFLATTASYAGLRCNGKLIRIGDLSYKVSKYCGAPDHLETGAPPEGRLYKAFLVYERNGGDFVIVIRDSRVRSITFHRS